MVLLSILEHSLEPPGTWVVQVGEEILRHRQIWSPLESWRTIASIFESGTLYELLELAHPPGAYGIPLDWGDWRTRTTWIRDFGYVHPSGILYIF